MDYDKYTRLELLAVVKQLIKKIEGIELTTKRDTGTLSHGLRERLKVIDELKEEIQKSKFSCASCLRDIPKESIPLQFCMRCSKQQVKLFEETNRG